MALYQIDYYSKELARIVHFDMLLPNDINPEMISSNENYQRESKTLFLLHGYSGSSKDWLLGSSIQELAGKYNLVVVMPNGENSFYLDSRGTGKAYCRFIGQELVEYVQKIFGLSRRKEDIFIGGFSMGGYGAIHTGLTYPNNFGKIIALSSALITNKLKNMQEGFTGGMADYDYYVSVFGDLMKVEESINSPEYLIRNLKKENLRIPPIYMACGTEDFLLEENREFHQFLTEQQIEIEYHESKGLHNWSFWNQYLEPSIEWLLRAEH
jgi:S-formylglutathione hydrolase FrmB